MSKVLSNINKTKYILYDNILEKVFYFFLFLVFARSFQPAQYGEFITINNLGNILITITTFGFYIQLQRLIAEDISKSGKTFSNFIFLYSFIFLSDLFISIVVYFFFYNYLNAQFFFCIILWTAISSLSSGLGYAYFGLQKYKTHFYINLIPKIIFFIITAGMIVLLRNFTIAILILSVGVIFHLFLIFRFFPYKINLKEYDFKYIYSVFIASLPLGAAITFNFLYDKIDILILSKMTDLSLVAMYGIAYGIYKSSSLCFSFIQTNALSVIAGLNKNKPAILSSLFKYAKFIIIICIGLNFIFYFFAQDIIRIIFSESYIGAAGVLKILSFAILPIGLNGLTGNTLNAIGFFRQNMYVTIIGLVFNVLMNLIFIPVFSIYAASVISLLTEIIVLVIDVFLIYKFIKS